MESVGILFFFCGIIGFCIWFFSMLISKMIKKDFIPNPKIIKQTDYEKNKQLILINKPRKKNKQKSDIILFFGLFITALGVIFLVLSLNMNTSVQVGYSDNYINNIGLMNDKQNYIIVSCFGILIGVLISVFSNFSRRK